ERLRTEDVAQRVLGLGADLANEECVHTNLAAQLGQRRRDERRAPLPLAVPVLIERRVELVATRRQERAGPLLRRRVRVGEHVERRDADQRGTRAAGETLCRGDRDAETGERSGTGGDGDLVDRRECDARSREQALDGREQLVGVTPLRVPRLLREDIATVVERDRG